MYHRRGAKDSPVSPSDGLWLMSKKNKVNSRGSWETGQTGLINNFKPIDSAHYVTLYVMMNTVKANGCKF